MSDPLDRMLARFPDAKPRGKNWLAKCPAHDDRQASLSIGTGDDGRVLLRCFAGCEFDAILAALGIESRECFPDTGKSKPQNRAETPNRRIVAEYPYHDKTGVLVYQSVRYEPKGFSQRRLNGTGGWIWNMQGIEPLPYRLPELLASSGPVLIVEGEKDADNLYRLGFTATCNHGGAGKWSDELSLHLRGRDVAILPDNDQPGRDHAEKVAASLAGIAASVRVVELPGLPEKGDVSDWIAAGGTADQLRALIDRTEPLPQPERIDGSELLTGIERFTGRFVAYPSDAARIAHTLWLVHTHLMDCWESTPRIAFLSPEPGSGKTRALEVSELLVPRPIEAVSMSAAVLFRMVGDKATGSATVLFDEVDTVFGTQKAAENNEDVRGLLNAGHRRGAKAYRSNQKGDILEYEVFAAVALAGLGDLPDTILSRSIIVRMRKRGPGERVEPYRRRLEASAGHALRDRIARWARQIEPTIGNPWPAMPGGIEDRDADVWESLFAVADAAGGDWPNRARSAAVELVTSAKERTPSLGVQLLSDLRAIFGDAVALSTEQIIGRLCDMDESPWAEIAGGKPLNARGLSKRLKPYGVKSTKVRTGPSSLQGYRREDLYDAWTRYLSLSIPKKAEHPEHPEQNTENPSVHAENHVPDRDRENGTVPEHVPFDPEQSHLSGTYPEQKTPVFMRDVPDVPDVPYFQEQRESTTRERLRQLEAEPLPSANEPDQPTHWRCDCGAKNSFQTWPDMCPRCSKARSEAAA